MKLTYRLNIKELWDFSGYTLRRNQYKTDYWNRMPLFLRITSGYYLLNYLILLVTANAYNHFSGYPSAKLENWIYNIFYAVFLPIVFYLLVRFGPRYLYLFRAVRQGNLKERTIELSNGYLHMPQSTDLLLNREVQVEQKKGMWYLIYPLPCADELVIPIPERAFESNRQKEGLSELLKRERENAEKQAVISIEKPLVTVTCNLGYEAAADIMELSLRYQEQRKARLGNIFQLIIWFLVGFSTPYLAVITGQMIWLLTWTFVVLFARELTKPERAEKRYRRDIQNGAIPELLGDWKMICGQEGLLLNYHGISDFYRWSEISLLADTDEHYVLCNQQGNMICALPKDLWNVENLQFNFRALCMNYGVKAKNAHTEPRNRGKKAAKANLIAYLVLAVIMTGISFLPILSMIPSIVEKAEKFEEEQKWVQEEKTIEAGPKDELVDEAIDALDEQIKILEKLGIQVPKTVQQNQETFAQMSSSAAEEIIEKPYVDTLCRMGRVEDYGDGAQFSDQIHWLDTQNDYYSGKNYSYILEALNAMSDGELRFKILEETPYENIRFSLDGLEYEFAAESSQIFDHQYLTMLNEILEAAGYDKTIYICREPENYFFRKGDLMFLREDGWGEKFEETTGFVTEQP